jgi:Tfp pilus assembly protein PilW
MSRRVGGFSLVELLIAMAVMVTFGGALLSLVLAAESMARMQPEAADVQQRGRIALQILGSELGLAGAGFDRGAHAGPLAAHLPPIATSADGGITIWYVSSRHAQTSLAAPLAQGAVDAIVEDSTGFTRGSTAILLDGAGCYDLLRVDEVVEGSLHVRAGSRACAYAAGAAIAQGEVRTYRVDAGTRQLLRRDEATGISVPLLDNVAAMTVASLDGGRSLRLTLRLSVATVNPLVPDLELTFELSPPNLRAL